MEIWIDIWDIVPTAALCFCAAENFGSEYPFQGKLNIFKESVLVN